MRPTRRYPPAYRTASIALVHQELAAHSSQWAAIRAIAAQLGISAETLRTWVHQADIDAGRSPGVTTEERRLRRENARLASTITKLAGQTGRPARGRGSTAVAQQP